MKFKHNNLGVTLVALVVTIIVLLILAGITISAVLGNNGLILRARNASEIWINASRNEEEMLDEFSKSIAELTEENDGKLYWGSGSNKREGGLYRHDTGELIISWTNLQKMGVNGSGDVYELGGGLCFAIENNVFMRLWEYEYGIEKPEDDFIYPCTFAPGYADDVEIEDMIDHIAWTYDFVIPNGVTRIFEGSFQGRTNLVNLYIPSSVTKIDTLSTFEKCYGLENVYYDGTEEQASHLSLQPIRTIIPSDANLICTDSAPIQQIANTWTCGNTTKQAGLYRHSDGTLLKSWDELQSTGVNGSGRIYDLSNNLNIVISEKCLYRVWEGNYLPREGVGDSGSLEYDLVIPNSIQGIALTALKGRTNLIDVYIPVSARLIDDTFGHEYDTAYEGCDKLQKIYYSGTQQQYNTTTFEVPEDVTLICSN